MNRKVVCGQAFRAVLSFAAPAHERSQQRRDESKKCPSKIAPVLSNAEMEWKKGEKQSAL
jgi:hypothetical protein